MRKLAFALVVMGALTTAALAAAAPDPGSDRGGTRATVDSSSALVQLKGDPLATSSKARGNSKKLDVNSGPARSYRAELSNLRNDFKQWLRRNAPNARVGKEFDVALNAVSVELNGTTLETLRSAPQVASAELQGVYYPTAHDDPDLRLISAFEAWTTPPSTATTAGEGVKVAIIDSGIDVRHPCFADEAYPENNNSRPDNEVNGGTNDKVIVAEVFHNKARNQGFTAADENSHGTHVAGTVACNAHMPATIDDPDGTPVDIRYDPSGVAPRALLGNFNVFPDSVANARSEDILDAMQRAAELGFDVINMSLGGGSNGRQDLLSHAVDNLDRAGIVVAIAAGNTGPGDETIESPGFAARAIAAGASTVGHFVGAPLTVNGVVYEGAVGDFATVTAPITEELVVLTSPSVNAVTGLSEACSPLSGPDAAAVAGNIALISRGTCAFTVKIRNLEAADAAAVIVVNNVAGDPTAMGSDGTPNQPTTPAYMVGKNDGLALKAQDGEDMTIPIGLQYFEPTGNHNIMASFSSRGPTDVDFRVKPDVTAPGVNVLSSQPAWACTQTTPSCWAFFQGTSMATPHIAGSAAVVIHQHPTWTAADVRSAIVNTAVRGALKDATDGTTTVDNPNIMGSGLENLKKAVDAAVSLDPVSISFGSVPSGSGQTRTGEVIVKNLSTASTYTFSIEGPAAARYSASPSSVTLAPGQSATIRVTRNSPRGAQDADQWAWLIVKRGGTEVAHAAIYTRVK